MSIRVLIVDGHPLFRDGLRFHLQQQSDFTLVGEADTVESAVNLALELRPDVALIGLNLTNEGGVRATRQIQELLPQIRIIALAAQDEPGMLSTIAKAGAHGYILKQTPPADLMRAIRAVLTQGAAFSPGVLPDLLLQFRRLTQTAETGADLTSREQEILSLIASGATNREIADCLALSTQTVKNILSGVYTKLGVSNRTEAAVVALDRGAASSGGDSRPFDSSEPLTVPRDLSSHGPASRRARLR